MTRLTDSELMDAAAAHGLALSVPEVHECLRLANSMFVRGILTLKEREWVKALVTRLDAAAAGAKS